MVNSVENTSPLAIKEKNSVSLPIEPFVRHLTFVYMTITKIIFMEKKE
jgi:hypothetical protein